MPDACLKSVEFGYQVSCYRALIGGYKNIQTIVGAAGIILSAIQLIGVFLTYLLIRNLPAKDEHEQHRFLHPEQRRLLDPNFHPDRYYYYGGVPPPPPGATSYGAGGYYAGPAYGPAGTSAGGPTGAGAGAGNVPTGSLKDPKVNVETETTGLGGTATEGTVSPTGVTSDTTF
ncbi:hypothetical protein AMAG_19898 [Allomyces macrogynus ATCC 38327]|uniref:Uncharacterized protein n=1 Tax=Allomyces macrogynus (strain ATCC 38327) TaxID=578462 RepID=A0A0L0T3L9_ALLM3|nr:hypothetical protein AMAG_19898 [Allomyces macrogynus ATCC 38327]|eukprot:KNE69290.1 hypothetical protein AMAG_19898 [Allomyces macrogynus ATCC 38327]